MVCDALCCRLLISVTNARVRVPLKLAFVELKTFTDALTTELLFNEPFFIFRLPTCIKLKAFPGTLSKWGSANKIFSNASLLLRYTVILSLSFGEIYDAGIKKICSAGTFVLPT